MSSHAGRNEYVLSEVGKVYAGTHNKIAGIDLEFYLKHSINTNPKKHAMT